MTAVQRAGIAKAAHARRLLSERELDVLRQVERMRFLTARQIESLVFHEHASPLTAARICRRVLERLTRGGMLRRLERRIGGVHAGSASYVYRLGTVGYRVLHDESLRGRLREPSEKSLAHTLEVAQVVVDLSREARSGAVELMEVEPEPDCWRRLSLGLEGSLVLKPDLAVALRSGDYEYHWFVELDRATHSAASVVRKCELYQRYWAAGAEQDARGLFPQVLFITPGARRQALLAREIGRARRLRGDLFAVCAADEAIAVLTGETP
jgi:hypothetical protein